MRVFAACLAVVAAVAMIVYLTFPAGAQGPLSPPVVVEQVQTPAEDVANTTVVSAPAVETIVADTVVTVPYGNWLSSAAETIWAVIAAIVAWGLRLLPGQVVAILQTMRADQLLAKARDYGINATIGAAQGKTLSINVGNEVLAKAVQYAIDSGPGWLVSWMGGAEGVRQKLIARIPTDPDVTLSPGSAG